MKKVLIIIMLLPFMAVSQTFEKGLLGMSSLTVKLGHSAQFEDGVKKWKECYLGNEGDWSWGMWKRVQGEGTVYALNGLMENWAEMDVSDDEAGKDCASIVMNFIMPHVEKSSYNLAMTLPDWSRKSIGAETGLVWVSYFRVKDRDMFVDVVKDVTSVMAEKEGEPRGYWYSFQGGGEYAPDYMVSSPYANFAALDEDEEGAFTMYEKAKGKKKADEMKNKWRMAVDAGWSYIWEYKEELSN